MMNVFDWEKKLLELANQFINDKLTAYDFYKKYVSLWNAEIIPDKGFQPYKDGLIHDIYSACYYEYCEPELRQAGDEEGTYYDDEQLKAVVKILFLYDTAKERMEKLIEANLALCEH